MRKDIKNFLKKNNINSYKLGYSYISFDISTNAIDAFVETLKIRSIIKINFYEPF